MNLKELTQKLDNLFKIKTAEDFDNVGLLFGNPEWKINGILICHDALEPVIEEAHQKGINFILSFHPIVFSPLKSITGKNYVEKSLLKAIEYKIAIYSVHTAFDNDYLGVNYKIANLLNLQDQKILIPKNNHLKRLDFFVPKEHTEKVRNSVLNAGAGKIGFYEDCSFTLSGTGTFTPKDTATPFIGEKNEKNYVQEDMVSCIFEAHLEGKIINALLQAHPYQEVAYQILNTQNPHHYLGLGRYGFLEEEMNPLDFLTFIKEKFNLNVIRHSNLLNKKIKKVALLGGSGSIGINFAKKLQCDAYISADFKYHDFFQNENEILLCDIGHFESEQFIIEQLFDILSKNFVNFAILKTNINTNPVNYF